MPKFKLEEFLLPWEIDKDGKKLEEPGVIDVEKLRRYVYGLLVDKEEAQEARDTARTDAAQIKDQLAEVQREHENEDQRRAREEKEREQRYAALEKDAIERRKLDALAEAFPDATAARIKRLAKRVTSEDENDWVKDAQELVEDGFRISDKQAEERVDESDDSFTAKPVRRSNGEPVVVADEKKGRKRSVADELNDAGIVPSTW